LVLLQWQQAKLRQELRVRAFSRFELLGRELSRGKVRARSAQLLTCVNVVVCSERETKMRFFSAKEDFQERTLKKVAGKLRALTFCAAQRIGEREYEHWGLAREYGKEAASDALRATHNEVFSELLRAPMQELAGELRNSVSSEPITEEWARQLVEKRDALVPAGVQKESARHFEYVAYVLTSIAASADRLPDRPQRFLERN
jgi:hypothetical protein